MDVKGPEADFTIEKVWKSGHLPTNRSALPSPSQPSLSTLQGYQFLSPHTVHTSLLFMSRWGFLRLDLWWSIGNDIRYESINIVLKIMWTCWSSSVLASMGWTSCTTPGQPPRPPGNRSNSSKICTASKDAFYKALSLKQTTTSLPESSRRFSKQSDHAQGPRCTHLQFLHGLHWSQRKF